jgi:glutamine amidotransferase
MAAFRRAGAQPFLAASPDELAAAAFAVLPGVGAFGSAMSALVAAGMDTAIRDRVARSLPTLGVCAGMQLFFEGSDESPGVVGMGIAPGLFRRFPADLPVPQLGWNRIFRRSLKIDELRSSRHDSPKTDELRSSQDVIPGIVREGWAYFANSYRLSEAPEGFTASWSEYGDAFVAALEGPKSADGGAGLLLCQFHPELSGPWGLALIGAWLGSPPAHEGGLP